MPRHSQASATRLCIRGIALSLHREPRTGAAAWEGDFSHQLMMVVVAKGAPDEDKKVALSILRQVSYTPKAKPHYKK